MTSAAQSINQGIGIQRANLWEPGIAPRILAIQGYSTSLYPLESHMEALSEEYVAKSLEDLNLVLVVGQRQTGTTGETCNYTGGISRTLRTEKRELKLVSARTAEVLSQEIVEGSMPFICPGTIRSDGVIPIGSLTFLGEVTPEDAVSWALENIPEVSD